MDVSNCPKCTTANPAGAKFCGNCGTAIAPAATPPLPPPAPPPGGFGGYGPGGFGAGGGRYSSGGGFAAAPDAQTIAPMPPDAAFEHVARTIQAMGGQIGHANPPQTLSVAIPFKNLWDTWGMKVRYIGNIAIAPHEGQRSSVQGKFSVDWNGAIPLLATLAACGFAHFVMTGMSLMTRNWAGIVALIWVGAIAYTAYQLQSRTPAKVGQRFLQALTQTPATGGAFAASQDAPSQQPGGGFGKMSDILKQGMKGGIVGAALRGEAHGPSNGALNGAANGAAHPVPPKAAGGDFELLERLAKLRDAGAISQEDFDTKKAEILARL